MLTEAMRRSGWRECPSSSVRLLWESTGGRWQQCWKTRKHWKTRELLPGQPAHKGNPSGPIWYRPVNPQTWDVDWRGWGAAVPTEPGLWWRDDERNPVCVYKAPSGLWWHCDRTDSTVYVHGPDGHWIAPCIKPEVS